MNKTIKFDKEFLAAIWLGQKTQTRRPLRPQPKFDPPKIQEIWDCPYGRVGENIEVEGVNLILQITHIRVERLHDITEKDAYKEGAQPMHLGQRFRTLIRAFECLWDQYYLAEGFGWDTNPWVWVIDFSVSICH